MKFWMETHYLSRHHGSSQQPLWSSLSEFLQEACLVLTQRGLQGICDSVTLALPPGTLAKHWYKTESWRKKGKRKKPSHPWVTAESVGRTVGEHLHLPTLSSGSHPSQKVY